MPSSDGFQIQYCFSSDEWGGDFETTTTSDLPAALEAAAGLIRKAQQAEIWLSLCIIYQSDDGNLHELYSFPVPTNFS